MPALQIALLEPEARQSEQVMGYDWNECSGTVTITAEDMLTHQINLDCERYACLAVRARLKANGLRPARLAKWERRCVPNSLQLMIRRKIKMEIESTRAIIQRWSA